MLAVSSHDRNNHPERDYIANSIDLHTAFLNADIRQDVFEEAPIGNCTKRCKDIAEHRNCGTNML